jgi:hypothetical protein
MTYVLLETGDSLCIMASVERMSESDFMLFIDSLITYRTPLLSKVTCKQRNTRKTTYKYIRAIHSICLGNASINKKSLEKLVHLLSLHKLTVNNLVAMVTMEQYPNPLLSKAHQTTLNPNNFKMMEAMGLNIIASSP